MRKQPNRDDPLFLGDEAERLLRECFDPKPLPPELIERTVRDARAMRRRARLRGRARRVAAAVLLLGIGLSVAAGVWRWCGQRGSDLDYEMAIQVMTDTSGYYKPNNVQAATGRMWGLMVPVLERMRGQGLLDEKMRTVLLGAADGEVLTTIGPRGSFERIAEKLEAGTPLSPAERAELEHELRAGLYAMRRATRAGDDMEVLVDILRRRLRTFLTESAGAGELPSDLPEAGGL